MTINNDSISTAEPLLTYAEIAEHFRVSVPTIERWVKAGAPSLAPSRKATRFKISDMENWASQRRVTV